MSLVVFRTNAGQDTGIGHMVRCAGLASAIVERGGQCLFVVDRLEDAVRPFLANFDVISLYGEARSSVALDNDASAFVDSISERDVSWVVIDDYRLGYDWERYVRRNGHRVCVIDDVVRRHDGDVLVDMRWRGRDTQNTYDGLVPPDCRLLLGPAYVLTATRLQTHSNPVADERGET